MRRGRTHLLPATCLSCRCLPSGILPPHTTYRIPLGGGHMGSLLHLYSLIAAFGYRSAHLSQAPTTWPIHSPSWATLSPPHLPAGVPSVPDLCGVGHTPCTPHLSTCSHHHSRYLGLPETALPCHTIAPTHYHTHTLGLPHLCIYHPTPGSAPATDITHIHHFVAGLPAPLPTSHLSVCRTSLSTRCMNSCVGIPVLLDCLLCCS